MILIDSTFGILQNAIYAFEIFVYFSWKYPEFFKNSDENYENCQNGILRRKHCLSLTK